MITALVFLAVIFSWPAYAGPSIPTDATDKLAADLSRLHAIVMSAGGRHCHHHRYHRDRYYDGPRSDYSTRWYGENAGTVHYGY